MLTLQAMFEQAESGDAMTQAHLADLAARVERWLDVNLAESTGGPARGLVDDEPVWNELGCWERGELF